MEAVPKLPLISFELKVSSDKTHFGPKLKQYISDAYREDPDSYNNEMHQLECLRSAAVRPTIDSDGINALTKYFCQLRAMQSRFPMAKGQPAACSFSWKDLYANMSCGLADIRFEMACILYNIGALHTQLGASEPRTSPDSLKAACTHYQNAAWAFMYLREHYAQPSGVDVSADNMRLLQEICFAQAQECILDKSIQDTRKPSVVGAVATQVMLFYKNALALLGPSTGTDNIHEIIGTKLYNYWHRYLSFKFNYTGCIVCLYQGLNAEEQQKMGERLAFYQQAADKLAEARKLAKYIEPVQITQEALTFTNDVVEGKRKAAKNENEFIYHEEVPAKDLLADLKPVCLVKALPIIFNDPEVSGPDIFSRLVPMGAHEASSLYSEEKAKLLRQVVNRAEAKNTELTEFMSSLQLDQLEVLDADQKIPQEIVDRCAAMNAKSEIIQSLVDSMNNLAEIISDVEHSLSEIKSMIQEEIQKEKEFQKVMGPRPPSIVQTELSREFHKYQEAHSRTNESNQVLHKAMTLHIANLKLLAQPLDVLNSKIPNIDHIEGLDRETMLEMRRVVGKAREMQNQRDYLIQHLREDITSDDVTAQLLARTSEPADEIFRQELEKHTPKVKIIEQNLSAQENIINKLTSLYAAYGESRRLLSDVLRKREGLIHALVTSYDTYEELLGKSQKGLEFYKKLSVNVNQLLSRLRSTCQVQEEERAQQLAKQGKAPLSATPPPASPAAVKMSNVTPTPTNVGGKLKDYLPYMKNRGASRSHTPQVQDPVPSDQYYPESIYPTSVRPAPLGSEATDPTQMSLTDGMANMTVQTPYNRFNTPYSEPYNPYSYPATSKSFDKDDNYGYSAYTPSQYPSENPTAEHYSNPYYSANNANPTTMTDSQNTYANNPVSQAYNPYGHHTMASIPEAVSNASAYSASATNIQDINNQFTQMQVTNKEGLNNYSQTFYDSNYPHTPTPNMATYSHAPQNSTTSMVASQIPTNYNSLNYPYSTDPTQNQYGMTSQAMASQYGTPQNLSNQADMQNQQDVQNQQAMQNQVVGITNQTGVQNQIPNQYGMQMPSQLAMIPQPPMSSQNMPVQPNMSNQPGTQQQGITNQHVMTNPQVMTSQPGMSNAANPYNVSEQSINASNPYGMPDQYYGSQGYTLYTNAESIMTSTTSVVNAPQATPTNLGPPYNTFEGSVDPATLAQLDAMDQPIKSHVTGEALSTPSFGYNYDQSTTNLNFPNPSQLSTGLKQAYQPGGSNINQQNYQVNYALVDQQQPQTYSQTFQNHPGYTFNNATGNYEYSYGSQDSYFGQANVETNAQPQVSNWSAQNVYTSAGSCDTVQSPSEVPQNPQMQPNNQEYYNAPSGYQTITNQANEIVQNPNEATTNYGANMNQSNYMQSGPQNTNVTFSNNTEQVQISTPKQNVNEPSNFDKNITKQKVENNTQPPIQIKETQKEVELEPAKELSTIDLLSDIDFTVEAKPLMPEIKVPQISESVMKKVSILPKPEPVKEIKDEVIERPAKRDLFSDAMLLNRFTAEVKALQKLVDSFTERTAGGLTVLDAKWKNLQEVQAKENMTRSKSVAVRHAEGSAADVAPYDDSRLTIKNDRHAYVNASYYKQLASWCIPLVISRNPSESEHSAFWRAVIDNKISCVVCLLSEIEVQGKSYWPTAIGQTLDLDRDVKVTLEDVTCTVHWTERKLTVTSGRTVTNVTHYQINVFPAKIVCSPLVLLSDKILSQTYDNRLSNQLTGALIQCDRGAGRSSVMALLIMVMCQVRAGQIDLCDLLEAGCVSLYKHRTNVLEDTKYLFDAYRAALYYVQGVLCSGTPMFNGEAVVAQSPTHALPQPAPAPAPSLASHKHKLNRESFEEMKQAPGLKSGDMKDPLNFLDPLWSLKKK